MKIFFDTNVHNAEALLGGGAARMLKATRKAKWRMYSSLCVIDKVAHVLVDELGFSRRLALLSQRRITRRFKLVKLLFSRAKVPKDPKDSPVLQAALSCGADYPFSNDRHLLSLDPFEGLRIISMTRYHWLLKEEGLLK